MKLITKEHFLSNKDFFLSEMKIGKIFIYPTDTVLGIGCVVSNTQSIDKIFELKQRENKPLLIIIPGLSWLKSNCNITKENYDFIGTKLPGAYSFVVNLKQKEFLYSKINNSSNTIGIRIPNNWFTEIISSLGEAFITTSVNISGEPSVLSIEDIPKNILDGVDYVVENNDEFLGKSSCLIDMRSDKMEILRK